MQTSVICPSSPVQNVLPAGRSATGVLRTSPAARRADGVSPSEAFAPLLRRSWTSSAHASARPAPPSIAIDPGLLARRSGGHQRSSCRGAQPKGGRSGQDGRPKRRSRTPPSIAPVGLPLGSSAARWPDLVSFTRSARTHRPSPCSPPSPPACTAAAPMLWPCRAWPTSMNALCYRR
jgi:hypothetical protein